MSVGTPPLLLLLAIGMCCVLRAHVCAAATLTPADATTADDASGGDSTTSPTADETTESGNGGNSSDGARSDSTFASASVPPQQHIPLVRLPSNTLLKYSAYKDVSILHFRIPADTRTALFSFKAYDESKSAFRKCSPPSPLYSRHTQTFQAQHTSTPFPSHS